MNRRLFSKLFATAPVMAGSAISKIDPAPPPPVNLAQAGLLTGVEKVTKIATPAHYDDYWKARETRNRSMSYLRALQNARNNEGFVSYNIACLRSVSPQHKVLMEIQRRERIAEENRSFLESLLDKFGMREWFTKTHGPSGVAAEVSADPFY